ncbi:MAG: DUF4912 domain-containing protein, partial [Planctomycetaceae bacterium]|nr:DUF4912 domain-containing protein [Planctomycetaceae bacterium]
MVSANELNGLGVKRLGALAKKLGVMGWHEMKKADLVRAICSKARSKTGNDMVTEFLIEAAREPKPERKKPKKREPGVAPDKDQKEKIVPIRREMKTSLQGADKEDRLTLLVRGPFWIQAFWELNSKTIERAKAAMGHLWYTAVPVLRLFKLNTDSSGQLKKQFLRNVFIHG